ncbi:glycosyltransferase [Cetobacterium somerae]|uniref:glycosyltransferase n=1 Tax=Cetobacterium sp. NK01 TaxID=2993530 RepID=UPI00211608B3|nr:glycosyltransferase [Cetobacterium sp. NK01]MCQ8213241.1 glycosyltransferase [Cetobacterium sp. NK01]
MQKKYDLVILTNLSSFYKINLYNEIIKKQKIFVIFISKYSKDRNEDFFKGEKKFEYTYLDNGVYEERDSKKNAFKLAKILNGMNYKKIALGGWDSLENWMAWLLSSKKKNAIVIESSEFESTNKGLKGILKKIFVSRISLGFASGESQYNLLRNVGYKGEVRKTKGVGIFNYKKVSIQRNIKKVRKFLYVGRLSSEKNLEQIIKVFNTMPNLELNIVGYGPLEEELKKLSEDNIKFLGKIDNEKLSKIYQNNDVFILPSKSEPWGLVVEEALYNGLPVILSNKVGCHTELIQNGEQGYLYNIELDNDLEIKINKIIDLKNYLRIKFNIEKLDFEKIKEHQIKTYDIKN